MLSQKSEINNYSCLIQALRCNADFDLPVVAVEILTSALEVFELVGSRKVCDYS